MYICWGLLQVHGGKLLLLCMRFRCMVRLSNLPAEPPKWQSIKDALRERLPDKVRSHPACALRSFN